MNLKNNNNNNNTGNRGKGKREVTGNKENPNTAMMIESWLWTVADSV